jgi:DNA replication initiation complex subunit (GINS family)
MEKGAKITYETLFDLLRNEKNREELQAIDKEFFSTFIEYIQDKEKLVSDNSDNQLFSGLEREKTTKQLDNAKKLIKELYERREKKILNMAMIASRTGGLLDKSSLLPEEEQLFVRMSAMLENFKSDILYRLLGGNMPKIRAEAQMGAAADPLIGGGTATAAGLGLVGQQGGSAQAAHAYNPQPAKDAVMVRFVHAVPKFIGKELEVYGPFEEEDIANLPKQLADILISKGRAELIQA